MGSHLHSAPACLITQHPIRTCRRLACLFCSDTLTHPRVRLAYCASPPHTHACTGGWDWAPYATTYNRWGTKVFSLGVWKDVYLVPVAPKAAAITHVVPAITYTGQYPTEPLTDATAAPFNINVSVHTWSKEVTTGTLTATGEWDDTHPVSASVEIPAGEAVVSVTLTAHGVKLWWPNGTSLLLACNIQCFA